MKQISRFRASTGPCPFHQPSFTAPASLTCDEPDPGFESAEIEHHSIRAGEHRQVHVHGRLAHAPFDQHQEREHVPHRPEHDHHGQRVLDEEDAHCVVQVGAGGLGEVRVWWWGVRAVVTRIQSRGAGEVV